MKLRTLLLTAAVVACAASAWAQAPDAAGVLKHDDGTMDTRTSLTMSGATVAFESGTGRPVTAIRFFGARYDAGLKPTDTITVTISDSSFKPIKRFDKKLSNISPGRETWQTIALDDPVNVSGKFYVTLIHASGLNKGVYIGADTTSPAGKSSVGVPGTVATDPEKPLNWMVRAIETDPSKIKIPVAVKPAPKPNAATGARAGASAANPATPRPAPRVTTTSPRPGGTAGAAGTSRPGVTNRKPMVAPNSSGKGRVAYRNPHRVLTFTNTPPRIPRGAGRVDATWNVPAPVTIELSYVGKPARVLEGLSVNRLVVDFPVPEPGLFNVVVRKPGYTSDSKQFRVVAGARLMWQASLRPGADNPAAPASPVAPVIDDTFGGPQPEPQPLEPGVGRTSPNDGEPLGGLVGPPPDGMNEPRGAAGAQPNPNGGPTMQPVPPPGGPADPGNMAVPPPGGPAAPPAPGAPGLNRNQNDGIRTRPDGARVRGPRGENNGQPGAPGAPGANGGERRRRLSPAPPPAPGAPVEASPEEGI